MIEVIKGKNTTEISLEELQHLTQGYKKIILDLGTGDGKFIYENAKNNPECFWIGVDPNRDGLIKMSSKIYKKEAKGGLPNAIFIIASIEQLPEELNDLFDEIYINYPWGTLLKHTILATPEIISNLIRIAKDKAKLTMYFNFSSKYEPMKMEQLGITDITQEHLDDSLIPNYSKIGIDIKNARCISNEDIKDVNAKWGKKLAFGRERKIWEVSGIINKTRTLTYSFTATGHPNILAKHFKTLEITKDNYLTERGDCIIGINANFDKNSLKRFSGRIIVELICNGQKDAFKCFVNPDFESDSELVFRKSKVNTERTFGLSCGKSANKLNRELINELQKGLPLEVIITEKEKRIHRNKYPKH